MRMRLVTILAALMAVMLATTPAIAACSLGTPGQTVDVAIGSTGRSVLLHRPTGDSSVRLPLVMLFHGSGSTAAAMVRSSKLEATSDAHGFVLAAANAGIPLDNGFAWNIPGVPTIAGTIPTADDADDVAFVGEAIDYLASKGCVDRTRVYATGLSGGGRMTSWLGCVSADRFAAIAPVVGLRAGNPSKIDPSKPDPATCRPSRPMPVMAFAGEADNTNPVAGGGAGYWQYSMLAGMTRWAELDRCRKGPVAQALGPVRWEYGWSDCSQGAEVIAHMVTGAGHSWVADNESLWAFFARHSR